MLHNQTVFFWILREKTALQNFFPLAKHHYLSRQQELQQQQQHLLHWRMTWNIQCNMASWKTVLAILQKTHFTMCFLVNTFVHFSFLLSVRTDSKWKGRNQCSCNVHGQRMKHRLKKWMRWIKCSNVRIVCRKGGQTPSEIFGACTTFCSATATPTSYTNHLTHNLYPHK